MAANSNLLIIFLLGISVLLVVFLILLTRRSEHNSNPIIIPADITKLGSIISFVLKIGLERPRAMAILSLVMVTLTISGVVALDAFTQHIRSTKPVAEDVIIKVDNLDKKLSSLSLAVDEIRQTSLIISDKTRALKSIGNDNDKVTRLLSKFLFEYDADRISVLEFHTESDIQSHPEFTYVRMSVTQERVDAGISKEINASQNIPVRELRPYLDDLIKHQCFTLNGEFPAGNTGSTFQAFLAERGTARALVCPLFIPLKSLPIGVVLMEWQNENIELNKLINTIHFTIDNTLSPVLYEMIIKKISEN